VQTFLPYADFRESASVLDYRRLGKQRVETKQILNALSVHGAKGWRNHPATKMWAGHEVLLAYYGLTMCREWLSRGYVDNLSGFFLDVIYNEPRNMDMPWFVGNSAFHLSHQSNLLRKDSTFYGDQFPNVPDNLPYIWTAEQAQGVYA
jgi:hypothetical protein